MHRQVLAATSLVSIRFLPPFEIFLPGPALLFFFDRPLPRLVRLFGRFPVRSLARIISVSCTRFG
jgi:hypothetical protein